MTKHFLQKAAVLSLMAYGHFFCGFSDVKAQEPETGGLEVPEAFGATEYTGDSFVANWSEVNQAEHYLLNLYSLDNKNTKQVSEDFSQVNSTEGSIDEQNPNFPQGWEVSVSTFGTKDVVFDGTKNLLAFDADGDYIQTPYVDGVLKSLTLNINVFNADAQSDESTVSVFQIDVFNRSGKRITGGTVSSLLFADIQEIEIFNDLFQYIPEMIGSVRVSLVKNEGVVDGDLMINSISFTYEPKVDVLQEERVEATSLLVENLNPEEVYYYDVKAAKGTEVSAMSNTVKVDQLLKPEVTIEQGADSYTANWNRVPRADFYQLINYKVVKIAQDGAYGILDDQFDQITEGTREQPVSIESADPYTNMSGWQGNLIIIANGMLGADNGIWMGPRPNPGFLQTPVLDLSRNGGKYTIHIKAYGQPGDYLSIYRKDYVVDGQLNIHATQPFSEEGYVEETWEMTDGVENMRLSIEPRKMKRFFIDEITVSQEVKAGDVIKTTIVDNIRIEDSTQLSNEFTGLDAKGTYGFEMYAGYIQDNREKVSETTELQVIDLSEGSGIETEASEEVAFRVENGCMHVILSVDSPITVYTLQGIQVAGMQGVSGDNLFDLPEKIYLVKVGDTVYKVLLP